MDGDYVIKFTSCTVKAYGTTEIESYSTGGEYF